MEEKLGLKVGVHGLAEGEAGLVRAFVLLMGSDTRTSWDYVGTGACDVLVTDEGADQVANTQARCGARAVLRIGATGGQSDLARPLRLKAFEASLRDTAGRWASAGTMPAPIPATEAQQVVPPDAVPTAARNDAVAHAAVRRYKLRRWPPTELLRGDAGRVRIASHLSRRHLCAQEVAQLTQIPAGNVATFLQLLQGFNLLEVQAPPGNAIAPAGQADSRPAPLLVAPAAPRRSLVQSIRRRLGL